MNREEVIEISDDDEDAQKSRISALETAVKNAVDAIGGFEDGRYRPGDECLGCLKDLKRLWRMDDRAVAAILWSTRALPNDLVPLLLETAGRGLFEDKRATACVDLIAAMTWPVDVAEELKELAEAEEEVEKEDYTQLLQSHLYYKAALLRPGVMEALLGIILPSLAKVPKERTDRDTQVVGVILYLIRNLAFIRDLPPNAHSSTDHAELAALQTKFIKLLSDTHVLDLVLTMASNAGTDPMFERWNTLVLEIFYLLFRGVKPESLAADQSKESTQTLRRLLSAEDKRKRDIARNASSRHSRFGTTISVTLNPKSAQVHAQTQQQGQPDAPLQAVDVMAESGPGPSTQAFVLHRQQALRREAGSMLDMARAKKALPFRGVKRVDELAGASGDNLSIEARTVLQGLAKTFLDACFNPFLTSLLKDIKAERPKVVEKDHLRLLFLTKWFVEFFIWQRANDNTREWGFGLVADAMAREWIVWVLRRMRQAVNEKPKLWTELQAGIESLTQLLQLIECMVSSTDASVESAAELLQIQLVYNGEVLDLAFDSLKAYKSGTQSLAYLESSVHLAYALLRRLEKYIAKEGGSVVRRKAKRKTKNQRTDDEGGVPEDEEEVHQDEEEETTETFLTFEAYEQKFASPEITQTLLAYLSRCNEFTSSEYMKRVVNLMHRQAIKAKAEGLFFKVSTLNLFNLILTKQKSFPKEQPYKDLINLVNFILRKFFKAVAEDSFLIVEAFFPKNRGKWKALSSWEPPEKTPRVRDESVPENRWPQDVRVKKGYTWTQQLGIAVAALVDAGKMSLVDWVKQILSVVAAQRQRIVEDTDGSPSQGLNEDDDGDGEEPNARDLRTASMDAIAKFTDYMIPYVNDEQAEAVTKDPHFKLLFRLLSFAVLTEDAEELEWYVPQAIVPQELERSRRLIEEYMEKPLDLEGKKAAQLLHKKPRKRRRRRQASSEAESEDDEPRRQRKEKKKKENKQYKSAQFIEDSDVEGEELEKFFEKERELREKTARMAAESGKAATMQATGTKKRRKRADGKGKGKGSKRPRLDGDDAGSEHESEQDNEDKGDRQSNESDTDSDEGLFDSFASPKQGPSTARTSPESDGSDEDGPKAKSKPAPRPRPKPRPRPRATEATVLEKSSDAALELDSASLPPSSPPPSGSSRSGSRAGSPIDVSSDEGLGNSKTTAQVGRRKAKPLFFSDEDDD